MKKAKMTADLTLNSFKAIKNPSDGSVMIYHALGSGERFDISVKRYVDKCPLESIGFTGICADSECIERFLLEICHECLEPCHLRDVVEDYFPAF